MTTSNPIPPAGGHHDDFTGEPEPHKPADDREQIYFEGSPMLRAVLVHGFIWVLAGLVIIAVPLLLRFVWHKDTIAGWMLGATLLLGIVFVLIPWIKAKTISYK